MHLALPSARVIAVGAAHRACLTTHGRQLSGRGRARGGNAGGSGLGHGHTPTQHVLGLAPLTFHLLLQSLLLLVWWRLLLTTATGLLLLLLRPTTFLLLFGAAATIAPFPYAPFFHHGQPGRR